MTVFSKTWNAAFEADPADGDAASGGALDIRDLKVAVQERGEVDHSWAGDADDGMHKKVTFVDPLGAKPTQANDETYLYTKDVDATSELFFEDEAGNEVQLTKAGAVQAFPAGTKVLFFNNAAPAGWTIDASFDDHIIFIEGTEAQGGDTAGATGAATVFGAGKTTGSHTLTAAESGLPAHTHDPFAGTTSVAHGFNGGLGATGTVLGAKATSGPVTGGAKSASSGHTHTLSLDIQYVKGIVCTKD